MVSLPPCIANIYLAFSVWIIRIISSIPGAEEIYMLARAEVKVVEIWDNFFCGQWRFGTCKENSDHAERWNATIAERQVKARRQLIKYLVVGEDSQHTLNLTVRCKQPNAPIDWGDD